MTPAQNGRIALGIALILIVIGVLAVIGHEGVVDQGVNAGVGVSQSIDNARRKGVRAAKTAATEASA